MEALPSRDEKANPLWDANFCSRLFFCWLNPLFAIGHKRKLEEDDMYKVLTEDSSKVLGERLQWYWDKEVQKAEKEARTPRLTKAIILCYWKSYLVLGCFTLVEETLILVQPIFLGMIIGYFEKIGSSHADENALAYAYGSAAALSVCTLILAIIHHLYYYHVQRAGMKLRVAMCHMIYHKIRMGRRLKRNLGQFWSQEASDGCSMSEGEIEPGLSNISQPPERQLPLEAKWGGRTAGACSRCAYVQSC